MKTCLIISGGDYHELPDNLKYDYVIAPDHGYDYAMKMGIKPDLILGDFDSCQYDKDSVKGIPVESFPVCKDDTDTMLAIKKALSLGYEHIIIACALGARFDHSFANIQSMAYVAEHGGVCELLGSGEYLRTLKDGSVELPKKENCSLSLFSLTDRCEGVCIKGSAYDCDNVTLTNSFPLGVSNKWREDVVTVSVSSGILLIVESAMK